MAFDDLPPKDAIPQQGPELLQEAPKNIAPPSAFMSPKLDLEQPTEEADEKEESKVHERLEDLDGSLLDTLARKAVAEVEVAKAARLFHEKLWVRLHQNEKGVYPRNFNLNGGTCKAFVQITRPKVMNAHARLVDVLLPPGEDAWDITPTPKPFVPELIAKLLADNVPYDDIRKIMQHHAEKAAMAMKLRVKDGLAETNWPVKLQESLLHMCIYGTSIIMGPFAVKNTSNPDQARRKLDPEVKNRLMLLAGANEKDPIWQFEDEDRPELEVYSPFFVYPDPSATTVEECRYITVKKPINKTVLMDLSRTKEEGFKTDVIEDILSQVPNGDWTPDWWEIELNNANDQPLMNAPDGKYRLYIRWGWLSGRDLRQAGISVEDDELNQQVMCQMWVVNNRVIFLQPSELHRSRLPFYFTPYSMVPHTIWGAGPAEFMMDSQDGINACERMKYDNLALSGRPMASVNVDRLAPGQDALELTPGRIFATINSMTGDGHRPVEWYMPPNILGEIQGIQNSTMQLADEQTNLPRNLMGMGGEGIHNRTASGASLQFNQAVTPLKGVCFNVDTRLITPMVNNMVSFYLKYSQDKEIVGDFKVVASGVSGLMAREVASQKAQTLLMAMSQNQELAKSIDPKAITEIILRGTGLYDKAVVFTDSERQKREAEAMDREQVSQAAGAQLQAEIQMNTQLALSKAQNKMRAETSPRDVLLETLQGVPDDAKMLRLDLINTILENTGLLSEQLQGTLDYEKQKESLVSQDQMRALAATDTARELGPMELLKMNHAQKLAEMKRKEIQGGSAKAEY